MNLDKLKEQAHGKWLGIFENLGITVPDPKSHGPCPVCGGKDRFWTDPDSSERGTWFCNQCSPKSGDGWALVQRVLGITFSEAIDRVAEVIGSASISKSNNGQDPAKRRKMLNDIWLQSINLREKNQAVDYLLSRGLYLTPRNVRFCKSCYCGETKTKIPAMIALFTCVGGRACALHRTYLDGNAKAQLKSPRMIIGVPGTKMAGGAVRLYKHDDTLGIAEGIETAISAAQLFDVPVWAALSSTLLESWAPPEEARKIIIFGDNDSNFAGQKSAYKLASKLCGDRIVEVKIPDNFGDWNDELLHLKKGSKENG